MSQINDKSPKGAADAPTGRKKPVRPSPTRVTAIGKVRRLPVEAVYLDPAAAPTLQGRLAAALVGLILNGGAGPGTVLPSSRALAAHLGVSRLTVTLVYQDLTADAYLESRPRSGHVVAAGAPHRRLVAPLPPTASGPGAPPDWGAWLASEAATVLRRAIRKPSDWADWRYPFIFGQPDAGLFDHGAWRDCMRQSMGGRDFSRLATDHYGQDDPMLVDYICQRTLPRRGISARPGEVLITLGAQNALYIAVALLAPRLRAGGRMAVMEEPGYPDFAESLRRAGCAIHFQASDAAGLDPAALPAGAGLVMVTPSHNIPTGATMPLARRHALLKRARRDDLLILEDDYDFEMSYLAPPEPALKSLDADGRVIYVGSFSKSLFPGLRIGYMVGDAGFIAAARRLRSSILRHPPTHLQRITAYFLALGHYDAHITRLRAALRARRATLMAALAGAPSLSVAGAAHDGGSSVWLSAPPGVDSLDLAEALRAGGALIEPGAVFFENPPAPCPFFRLGYGSIGTDRIPEGVALIERTAAALAVRS